MEKLSFVLFHVIQSVIIYGTTDTGPGPYMGCRDGINVALPLGESIRRQGRNTMVAVAVLNQRGRRTERAIRQRKQPAQRHECGVVHGGERQGFRRKQRQPEEGMCQTKELIQDTRALPGVNIQCSLTGFHLSLKNYFGSLDGN
jgi:hypothetical protein